MKAELIEVLHRQKLNKFLSIERRESFLSDYFRLALLIFPVHIVADCVDPKDNMILECALSGGADTIVTGDDHLLRLNPWRGILILRPADYLAI
jgi:putative PIN family toxin of toxin-antitoxin system